MQLPTGTGTLGLNLLASCAAGVREEQAASSNDSNSQNTFTG